MAAQLCQLLQGYALFIWNNSLFGVFILSRYSCNLSAIGQCTLVFQPAESQPETLSALVCAERVTVTELRATKRLLNAFPCSRSAQAHNEVYQHALHISFKPVRSLMPRSSHSSVSISAAAEAAGCATDVMLAMCIQKRMNADGKSAAEVKPNNHVVQKRRKGKWISLMSGSLSAV